MTEGTPTPRRILLAGASGTIGAAVLRRLQAEGHAVTAPDTKHRRKLVTPGENLFESQPALLSLGGEIDQKGLVPVSPGGIDHQRKIGRCLRELQQAVTLDQFERCSRRGDGGKDGIDLAHSAPAASSFAQR